METLFVDIVPTFYDDLQGLMVLFGEFFAGGVLVAFGCWVIAFAVLGVFGWLETMSREEG